MENRSSGHILHFRAQSSHKTLSGREHKLQRNAANLQLKLKTNITDYFKNGEHPGATWP